MIKDCLEDETMTTEPSVETITATLGRVVLHLRRRWATPPPRRPAHQPAPGRDRAGSVPTLGDGQMLLPGIAEPRLWPFNSTP